MEEYTQKTYLLQRIDEAFEGVVLGQGVSLNETVVIDMYGHGEAELAMKKDERHDWKRLLDRPEFKTIHGIGGPSFFDAEGFRFHLPAYMVLCIQKPEEEAAYNILFQLTHLSDYQLGRCALLSPKQKRCVAAFLQYIRHNGGRQFEYEHSKIDAALANYWKKETRVISEDEKKKKGKKKRK